MNDVAGVVFVAWLCFWSLVAAVGIVWDQMELRARRARLNVSEQETAPLARMREPVAR